nr:MAG TPA: hypothetical protein [Caudoviricetes sp.]
MVRWTNIFSCCLSIDEEPFANAWAPHLGRRHYIFLIKTCPHWKSLIFSIIRISKLVI